MPCYTYRPLLSAKNSIRLIRIIPGLPETEIHCQIFEYAIRDDQVSGLFEALSYVWGDPTEKCRIHVSDLVPGKHETDTVKHLEITVNLHAALQQLRDPALPRLMWIDAISINQDDLTERAHQVQFMARIYSHASRVIVWLGAEDDDTAEIFAMVEDIADSICRSAPGSLTEISGRDHRIFTQDEKQTNLRERLLVFLSRPWFRRIWVLQEVAAARHITVKCGSTEMSGSSFVPGVRYLSAQTPDHRSRMRDFSFSVLQTMTWNTSILDRPNKPKSPMMSRVTSLGELLDKFYLHEASDERDKVFALLGMCDAESRASITADYTKPWNAIWRATVQQILGPRTRISISNTYKQACITAFGRVLGSFREHGKAQEGLSFEPSATRGKTYLQPGHWHATCGIESWCNPIRAHDIVFHVSGAAQPSVVRVCGDHFDIVVIALPQPLNFAFSLYGGTQANLQIAWEDFLEGSSRGHREITLVWDWDPKPSFNIQHQLHCTLLDPNLTPHPDLSQRIHNFARILGDAVYHPTMLTHLFNDSHGYKVPPGIQESREILRLMYVSPDTFAWLARTLEELKWVLWVLQHETSVVLSPNLSMEYTKSDCYLKPNLYDLLSSLGLSVQLPSAQGEGVRLHCTNLVEAKGVHHLSELFSKERNTSLRTRIKAGRIYNSSTPVAEYHVTGLLIRFLTSTLGVNPSNFRPSLLSIITQPIIGDFSPYNSVTRESRFKVNTRAVQILFEIRRYSPFIQFSVLHSLIGHEVAMEAFCVLFTASFGDIKLAYEMLDSVLNLDFHNQHCESLSDLIEEANRRRLQNQPSHHVWKRSFQPQHVDTTLLEVAARSVDDCVLPFFLRVCEIEHTDMAAFKEEVIEKLQDCIDLRASRAYASPTHTPLLDTDRPKFR